MSYNPKSPEWDAILALCDEWEKIAQEAYDTFAIATQPDTCGYKAPPFKRFQEITSHLIEWCKIQAREIDGTPLETLATDLSMPHTLRDEPLKKTWKECQKILERLRYQGTEGQSCVFDPARKILILNGKPIALDSNEEDVIKKLVEAGAIQLKGLRKSGCNQPHKVIANLLIKYPDLKNFIFMPGAKGKGGYSTKIVFTK